MRPPILVVLTAILLLAVGCGGAADDEPAAPDVPGTDSPAKPTTTAPATSSPTSTPRDADTDEDAAGEDAGDADLVARLGGDASLEGGCAWLTPTGDGSGRANDAERYEPRWPPGYEVTFEPLRLTGPGGEVVAGEGDTLRVRGEVAADVMTVCQVGPVFEVTEVLGAGR